MATPLTLEQLRDIQSRNLSTKDVMVLLREIRRLRQLIVMANHLFNRWGDIDDDTQGRIEWLQEQLELEPCTAEHEAENLLANRDEISQKRNAAPRINSGTGNLLR